MREYSFVLDRNHNSPLSELLKILDNPDILISRVISNKYGDTFSYIYKINDSILPEEETKINDLLQEISFIPLILTLEINYFKYTHDNKLSNGVKSFLYHIINMNYGILPSEIKQLERLDYISNDFFIEYYPYYNGSQIFINKNLYRYIDLSEYLDYSLLLER